MACSREQAKAQFLGAHGSSYGYKGWVDQHWAKEVGQRLGTGAHYLDMTGAGLYTNSQIAAVMHELATSAFGNPHSRNPSSSRSTREVEGARKLVLQFFNADPEQYYVVFTKGATEGLKMVGEYFPWAFASNTNSSSSALQQPSTNSDTDSETSTATLNRTGSSASSMSTSSDGGPTATAAAGAGGASAAAGAAAGAAARAFTNNNSSSSSAGSHFIYTQANHKSVLGIGAYARQCGAQLHCLTMEQMQQWLATPGNPVPESYHKTAAASNKASAPCNNGLCSRRSHPAHSSIGGTSTAATAAATPAGTSAGGAVAAVAVGGSNGSSCCGAGVAHHLVAYPAKDNYEGRVYPLDWIQQVHAKSDEGNRYFVALDTAAYAATHVLDLSAVTPDFVTLSFYKIFGYPTGLGALLIHKEAAKHLRKVYFGGGSVDYCTAEDAWAVMSAPPAGLEDGTLGFLNIASLKHGFDMLNRLGGMKAVEAHVESLRSWTYKQLSGLRHSNGTPLLKMFGAHEEGPDHQGGIFQFQVLTAGGDRLPGRLVEAAATAAGLHLRTGCNCNPGRCLPNLGITPEEERARAAEKHTGPVLVVLRPRALATSSSTDSDNSSNTDTSMGTSPAASSGMAAAAAAVHGSGAHQLVPVPLPVGSVRASLGALSTWEDCYALVRFLDTTFKDFQVNDQDLLTGIKMVSVLDHKQDEVTVEAVIRPSNLQDSPSHLEAVSCGDFFVAHEDDSSQHWYYQI